MFWKGIHSSSPNLDPRVFFFVSKENSRFFEEKRYTSERGEIIGIRKLDAPFLRPHRQTVRKARLSAESNAKSNSHRGVGMHTRTHRRYVADGVKFDSRVGAVSPTLPDLSRPDRKLWIRAEG